jgi:predicted lipid-binding transport protein (Tim44 family)
MKRHFSRIAMGVLVAGLTLGMSAEFVDAKPGKGRSSGSRGARTDMSVPSTPTAPRTSPAAAPTTTPGAPNAMPSRPGAPAATAAAAQPSRMSNMAKGFAAGLIGAGLFGLLGGGSLFGGLNGIMGFLGLLLQVALIALVVRMIWGFFKSRQNPQTAAAGYERSAQPDLSRIGMAGGAAAAPQAASYQPQAAVPQRSDTVGIGPSDYEAFQGVLTGVMASYSNEDMAGLRRFTTPEMAAGFIKELHENQTAGVVNKLGEPKLLQGDLAEAWYEDSTAYATVAIRYSMTDVTLQRANGQIVSGNPNQPEESVEIWTFRRDGAGKPWILAAQEQA